MDGRLPYGATPLDPDESDGLIPGHVSTRRELDELEELEVRKLVEDVQYWRANEVYAPDELAVRFHHRLVAIHPFPNGNGRHARMAADLLVQQAGRPPFSWGGRSLITTSNLRASYISALRRADNGDASRLLEFARS